MADFQDLKPYREAHHSPESSRVLGSAPFSERREPIDHSEDESLAESSFGDTDIMDRSFEPTDHPEAESRAQSIMDRTVDERGPMPDRLSPVNYKFFERDTDRALLHHRSLQQQHHPLPRHPSPSTITVRPTPHHPEIPPPVDPHQSPVPLPSSIHSTRPRQPRGIFYERPSRSRQIPRNFNDRQHRRTELNFEPPLARDIPFLARNDQPRARVGEWSPYEEDAYHERDFGGTYNSNFVRAGNHYGFPSVVHGPPVHISGNRQDREILRPTSPLQSGNPRSWRESAAAGPLDAYRGRVFEGTYDSIACNRYAKTPAVVHGPHRDREILRQGSPMQSGNVDPYSSASENEDAWVDLEAKDSQDFSGFGRASSRLELHSNVQADEDILNPKEWYGKMYVTEDAIKANHRSRLTWPDNWRHSDLKTIPKVLRGVWREFTETDHLVTQLGLDSALPRIDNSSHRSKRKGTLAEVVNAYKVRSKQEAENTVPSSSSSASIFANLESWDIICEQFQRLLRARDYLIAVCKDAEYLNDFHPTMDAITWFEAAHVGHGGPKNARSDVIELMTVEISHLADIIKSINVILRALLWGWSSPSTIAIHSDQETEGNDVTNESMALKLRHTRWEIFASENYNNGERGIQTCLKNLDCGLPTLIDEIEVFAAILNQALFYQCDVLIAEWHADREMVTYGWQGFEGLFFWPRPLMCMGELIQGRSVWVLEQYTNADAEYAYVAPPVFQDTEGARPRRFSYVRTTVADLARIWGPIWEASEFHEKSHGIWYRLPGGVISAAKQEPHQVAPEADEALCHFSIVKGGRFESHPPAHYFAPTVPYLLIGHGLPSALVRRQSCQTTLDSGLGGLALQSIGTLRPFKYKDSTAIGVTVGHAGTQASWTTQVKTNPGVLMKKSLLDRWRLEPKFRNPRLLLLWYGVEVSVCTRNARRCRLVDVIRSRSMIQYLSKTYHPGVSWRTCKTALFTALNDDSPHAFIKLYDNHPEWQVELGTVVAHCLQLLQGSGVNEKGELAAFVFVEKFHDPAQLAILSRNDHTWIPLLKDSFYSATFAILTNDCLGYPKAPGQMCRLKDRTEQGSKSVLETSYTSTTRVDMIRLFRKMRVKDGLRMADASRFNIKRQSSRGIILGTWHGGPLRHLHIPRPSELRFRERGQDGEMGIKVFVVSKKRSKLIRFREFSDTSTVIAERSGAPGLIDPTDDVSNENLGLRNQPARSPTPSNLSNTKEKSSIRQINAQTSAMDDNRPIDAGRQATSARRTPEVLITTETASLHEDNGLHMDKGTQTDHPVINPLSSNSPSPTLSGEFLLPVPSKPSSNSSSSRHHRGSSDDDPERDSARRRHRKSHGSHGASGHSSSQQGHRRGRSDEGGSNSRTKFETLTHKLGL